MDIFEGCTRRANGSYLVGSVEVKDAPKLMVYGSPHALHTPAMRGLSDFLHEGWETGVATDGTWLSYEEPVLWCESSAGECTGLLLVRTEAAVGSWRILIGWVRPDHRVRSLRERGQPAGPGVYDTLFDVLALRAAACGVRTITCATNADNIAAQRAFERQGRKLVAYEYEYVVNP